jgi:hypothetical protein
VRGHEKRGERLGVVEEKVGVIMGSLGAQAPQAPQERVRSRTRPVGVPLAPLGLEYGRRHDDLDPPGESEFGSEGTASR